MHGNKSNYQEPSMSGTRKYVQNEQIEFQPGNFSKRLHFV